MKTTKGNFSLMSIMIMSAGLFILGSCKKTSSTPPAPVLIGGYASSDSVAAANLVSYFPFNGNVNDTVGNQTGTAVGVTYVPGIRGEAYQGSAGAYATVTASSAFAALQSYSVSVWYSLSSSQRPQVPGPGQQNAQGLFFLSGATPGSNGNEMVLEFDNPSTTQFAADSVPIHNGFANPASPNYVGITMASYDTATSAWVHVVMTYDGPSSTYTFYENGVPIAVSSAWGTNNPTTILNGPTGSPDMGIINFASAPPTTIYLGTWPPGLYGVVQTLGANGCFQGAMDELRVYNRALTQAEVVGLYLNGLAGR